MDEGAGLPLAGLRCVVCGMSNSKPIEDMVTGLGGKLAAVQRHEVPDVVIADNASSSRLQTVLSVCSSVPPVVTGAWVTACESVGQRLPFEGFCLPVLTECVISFTNLDKRVRQHLTARIQALGGSVRPDMNKSCTYLIVGDPSQAPTLKQKAAHEWSITVLAVKWLHLTIEQRRFIPIAPYQVAYVPQIATLDMNIAGRTVTASSASASARASVPAAVDSAEQPHRPVANVPAACEGVRLGLRAASAEPSVQAAPTEVSEAGARGSECGAEGQPAGPAHGGEQCMGGRGSNHVGSPLLQGAAGAAGDSAAPSAAALPARPLTTSCAGIFEHKVLYVTGMTPVQHSRCSEIVRHRKGHRVDRLLPSVTHIVVGSGCWTAEKRRILTFADDRDVFVVTQDWLFECGQAGELVREGRHRVNLAEWRLECGADLPPSQAVHVLNGRSFCLDALKDPAERKQAKEYIRSLGGQEIVDGTLDLVHDWSHVYALTPTTLTRAEQQKLKESSRVFARVPPVNIANCFWLKVCRTSQSWVGPESILFKPLAHPTPFAHFENVCVLISGYGDGVRRGIEMVIREMGGRAIESVSCGQWSHITMLMCHKASGKKFQLARANRVPVVGISWMTACMYHGSLQPLEQHILQEADPTSSSQACGTVLPSFVDCTQACDLPQSVTQGGLRPGGVAAGKLAGAAAPRGPRAPRARQAPRSQLDRRTGASQATCTSVVDSTASAPIDPPLLRSRGNSLLQQLSQNLSVSESAADGATDNAGPSDFRQLKDIVNLTTTEGGGGGAGGFRRAASAVQSEGGGGGAASGPGGVGAQHMLQAFAAAHGVEPGSILGAAKRRGAAAAARPEAEDCARAPEPPGKRSCVRAEVPPDPASPRGEGNVCAAAPVADGGASQDFGRVLAGMTAAREAGGRAPHALHAARLNALAAQLTSGGGSGGQPSTQLLTFTQPTALIPAARGGEGTTASAPGRVRAGASERKLAAGRRRKVAGSHEHKDTKSTSNLSLWKTENSKPIHSTQVAFSQEVDFLAQGSRKT